MWGGGGVRGGGWQDELPSVHSVTADKRHSMVKLRELELILRV